MKKRYVLFGILFIYYIPGILIRALAGNYFNAGLIILPVLAFVLYLIKKVEDEQGKDTGLTKKQSIQVITTCVLSPVLAGAFYFYCWKNQFPKKAKQANMYSWITAIVESAVAILLNQAGIIKIF